MTSAGAPVAWALGLVFVPELVGAFASPAFTAFLPRVVPPEELPAASWGRRSSSSWTGISFLVDVASLVLLRLPREEGAAARGGGNRLAEWLAGFRRLFRSRMLRRVFAGVRPGGAVADPGLLHDDSGGTMPLTVARQIA